MIKLLLSELMRVCYEVSQGEADVFCDYSPHVPSVDLRIYYKGWKLNNCVDVRHCIYLDTADAENTLKRVILLVKELEEEKCTK